MSPPIAPPFDNLEDDTDIAVIDHYRQNMFDLGGTDGILDTEDLNIMEKIVEYYGKRVDNLVRQYADIDGNGFVSQTDITLLTGYLEDIASGDFKGNGPVSSVRFASRAEGQFTIDLTEDNSAVTEPEYRLI